MKGLLTALVVAAFVVVLAPLSHGQATPGTLYFGAQLTGGALPGPGSSTSYVTNTTGVGCGLPMLPCAGASPPCDDPDPTYALVGTAPAAGKAYTGRVHGGFACSTAFEYIASQDFVLGSDLAFNLVAGCDTPTVQLPPGNAVPVLGPAVATFDVRFLQNGAQIGGGVTSSVDSPCMTSAVYAVQGTFKDSTGTSFKKGDTLTIIPYHFFETGSALDPTKNFYFATGPAASFIQASGLPAQGGPVQAAGVIHRAVVADADLRISHANVVDSNDTYAYNWTAGPDGVMAAYHAHVTNGTALLTVKDGIGQILEVVTMSNTGNASRDFSQAKHGTYNVTLAFHGFSGSVSVNVTAIPLATSQTSTGTSTATTSGTIAPTATGGATSATQSVQTSGSSKTANATTSKGSPALGPVVALVALACLALARRRQA